MGLLIMDKENVIERLDSIQRILENAEIDISEYARMADEIDEAISELNSKPVMPKIFDKWMNYIEEDGQDNMELEFQFVLDMDTALDEPSEDLRDWLNGKSSKSFIEKINMCTNAILNGYEVEK